MTNREQPTNETKLNTCAEHGYHYCEACPVCDYNAKLDVRCGTNVPTPVPLGPREWLMDIAFVEKGDSDDVMTTISRIVQLLESYSSHVNAALMEKLAQLRIRAFRNSPNKSCDHATDCTIWRDDGNGNAPEFDNSCGPCNCGALERFQQKRAEAAESRISELERERDEARKQSDLWRDEANLQLHNRDYWKQRFESSESQLSTTQEALRRISKMPHDMTCGVEFDDDGDCDCHVAEAERVLSPPTKLP